LHDKKILLKETDIPKQWYNIVPDLPHPLPPFIEAETGKPGVGIVPKIFPKAIIGQEVSQERWIDIPDEVREIYKIWRPSPLFRAYGLEQALKTPAKIYYKYEGTSPSGSHKTNSAVPQAYYNMKEGITRVTTETGAGQWGSALSFAASVFGLEATVYMVRASFDQKPYRKAMMNAYGATVYASPSNNTQAGRKILAEDPQTKGSLGIAISEAIEDSLESEKTGKKANYTIGSVFNHVCLHQTVAGLEAQKQFAMIDDYPDEIYGCIGGGSSFSGLFWPFYYDKVSRKRQKKPSSLPLNQQHAPKSQGDTTPMITVTHQN
jgi:tryptophan synthase beta chain